ncbi:hypothetical protein [Lacimicrobium alkaliphilum]|uniref:Uncharacterized protein n=1 Tax=Lacimicrobium alkaliphilum TaxID=1526571 RepID=A0ABQ1RQ58_9ALTE|nr:hypothetical protein [Lacimicrobium alkaliphilum]GGD74154.1 hypothetical protein GCM10011357_31460 [Lacimicrobium alkaliphilum]
MTVKASLKIVLMANDVEIAESVDKTLWQKVFAAINQGTNQVQLESTSPGAGTLPSAPSGEVESLSLTPGGIDGLSKFAGELGITPEEVEGALYPSLEAPYIHLDPHCWEALKKNTPPRGPQAIAPISLAGTVLALWFKHAGIDGIPTTKQCQAVLKTIHTSDKNAGRSLRNTEWLQTRGNGIVVNPVHRSRAVAVAAAYCTKSPIAKS